MNKLFKLAGAVVLAVGLTVPAQAQTTIFGPGDLTTGTYFDYMKTVYSRAGLPEITQIPLTSFDKEFELQPLAAESWSLSDDGLVWTFKMREGLVWSDGEPLKASDYVFALKRAATTGYDFAWYWDFAGGIKNWKAITEGTMDVSEMGVKALDDLTIEVTTSSPKPYLPGVVSLWYPVPEHVWNEYGDEWAVNVDTLVSSGPFTVESWEKSNNSMVMVKSETYTGPWQARVDRIDIDPDIGAPEVGLPAYLAGETDFTNLNAGQIPFVEQRFPENMRTNVVFALSYLSFDVDSAPFDNVDVRRALWYAIDRKEMTETVLKGLAIPGNSLLTPGYPGYNADIAAMAEFNPEKAREFMAKAGYPNGEGFPTVEIFYRDQGGYNGAITSPMLQYLQAEFKEILGIQMDIRVMPTSDWMDALLNKKNNLFLAPYEFDYLDPSNFFGIFYDGGRHSYNFDDYDALVAAADANPNWEERLDLYEQAEMIMIDQAMIVPLVHPITVALVSDALSGEGIEPNALGFTPLNRLSFYFYTHLDKN
ncbi:MAG: peptide ABC transporter substrate-binding protein [Alphaproteobacteria bacterium]|nr:peptide ABC transporter substrate-binding protein [Alphaproteobacteria bacterium]